MKKIVYTGIVLIFLAVIIAYKWLFFQNDDNKFIPQTYTREYFQSKNNPLYYNNNSTLKAYNDYCLANEKGCSIFPHQAWFADQIRLKAIQQAGQTHFTAFSDRFYLQLSTISQLQPHREYPYILGQLLLPLQKEEQTPSSDQESSREKAIMYWELWISQLCKPELNDILNKLSDQDLEEQYEIVQASNSGLCPSDELPYMLAFNYYHYLQDTDNAIKYYKVAALSPGAQPSTLKMPAIILWRGGEHLKSASIWLDKAFRSMEQNNISYESTEYYIHKALFEWSLQLITDADQDQDQCHQDLSCLQNHGYINQILQDTLQECQDYNPNDRSRQTKCRLTNYGIENKFIHTNGELIYPIDPENFAYARRPDVQDRRIILKEDLK